MLISGDCSGRQPRAQAKARRLVLLVDGLDEDRGFTPGASLPSIASLLPKVPETAMRVIVSSRPTSPLPDDVPADHPLRRCQRRQLTTSPYATEIARLARIELSQLPLANALHHDTVGLITASGGGLTLADLEHLTGAAPFQLEQLLSGRFGRTIPKRGGGEQEAAPVYLFAHETLREEAVRQFGTTLVRYRNRIHRWADTYAARGWPPDTPAFLLDAYSRMLRDSRDTHRLCALVLDSHRQDHLLAVTGGDAAAFTEIAMTQDLQVSADDPDLAAMVLVAERRDSLATRNANIPVALPAVWVALGQDVRAESLARGMTDLRNQGEALAVMAEEYVRASRYQQALDVAASAAKAFTQVNVYVGILEALDDDGPDDVVRAVADFAADGLSRIADDVVRAWLTAKLAVALARVRDYEHAAAMLDDVEYLDSWASGAADIVGVAARGGDVDQAAAFLEAIETLVPDVPDDGARQQAQLALARAAALSGDIDKAVLVAEEIADTALRVQALTHAAGAASANGDHDRAASLARDVEATVRDVPGTPTADLLELLADALAYAGDFEAAEAVARSISNDVRRDATLSTLVRRLAIVGTIDMAERVARDIEVDYRRRKAVTELVSRLAQRGDHDDARRIAEGSVDPPNAPRHSPRWRTSWRTAETSPKQHPSSCRSNASRDRSPSQPSARKISSTWRTH
jgi:tetratricopeptide (TPR) repeat protein